MNPPQVTTHPQHSTGTCWEHVLPEAFLAALSLSSVLRYCTWEHPQKAASPETRACWTVVHSLARSVIPGLVSHYTSMHCRIISELRVCKIIINMFESVSCCVVFIQTVAGIQVPRGRQCYIGRGLRLAGRRPEFWSWCCLVLLGNMLPLRLWTQASRQ